MKLKVTRYSLQIIPETPQDQAFIEEVLGIKKPSDSVRLVGVAPLGMQHSLCYVETTREAPDAASRTAALRGTDEG